MEVQHLDRPYICCTCPFSSNPFQTCSPHVRHRHLHIYYHRSIAKGKCAHLPVGILGTFGWETGNGHEIIIPWQIPDSSRTMIKNIRRNPVPYPKRDMMSWVELSICWALSSGHMFLQSLVQPTVARAMRNQHWSSDPNHWFLPIK